MPGGAAELQRRIEQATGIKSLSGLESQGSSNQQFLFQGIWGWCSSPFKKFRNKPNQTPTLPQHSAQPVSANQGPQTPTLQRTPLHMMSCLRKGRYGKNLYQDRIETVNTDRELFFFLKERLTNRRSRVRSVVSLRSIQGIFFVKVRSLSTMKTFA